ncbi:XRE family transcriptional regulator [Virgibacillus sp. CBA3643]|uniref:XRE family transcriptional regulator n=1 Tax=Virgibacillus sp. CBA3643 TaxID=2942278 RepID=UPI0035A3A958
MAKLRIKLNEILDNKGITQKQLKQMIDNKHFNGQDKFRTATISEIYNNQRKTLTKEHLEIIFDTLELDNINELIEMTDD